MRKITFKRVLMVMITLFLTITLSGCANQASFNNHHPIRIACANTTESQIIANILAQLIQHQMDVKTKIIDNLGSSSVEHKAVQRNDADIVATSYTGTDLTGTLGLPPEKNPRKATRIVNQQLKKRWGEIRFPSYGFADTYTFMTSQKLARRDHLTTVSDLKPYASKMNAGGDSSWMDRKGDGYKEFTEKYGFRFKKVYPMQIGLVYDAEHIGKMQVILGYSTDGRIRSYHLHLLKDNRHFFPPYDAAPVASSAILHAYPQLGPTLRLLDNKISLKTMQKLNYKVDDQLLEPSTVAHQFLKAHHYFERSGH